MPGGLHPPPAVILSWTPNYVNPEKRGWAFPAAILGVYVLTMIAVFFRLLARFVYLRNAGLDDLFIIIAVFALTGYIVLLVGAFRLFGFNYHVWDLLPMQLVVTRKVVFCIDTLYTVTTLFVKTSILLFYRRLSSGTVTPVFHWVLRGVIAFVVITHIGIQITIFNSCRPLNSFWWQVDIEWAVSHTEGVDYTCANEVTIYWWSMAFVTIQDFMTVIIPICLLWNIRLPSRQKIALGCIFGLGFVTCFCALARIAFIYKIFYESYDVTFWAGPAYVTMGFEVCLGVLCASTPALKMYFEKFLNNPHFKYGTGSFASGLSNTFSKITGRKRSQNKSGLSASTFPESKQDYDSSMGGILTDRRNSMVKLSKRAIDESFGDDLELGGIEVTREVEVVSAYKESAISRPQAAWQRRDEPSPHLMSFSSERPLQDYFIESSRSPESWLEEDSNPSTPPAAD